jgi:hypothetical protein
VVTTDTAKKNLSHLFGNILTNNTHNLLYLVMFECLGK